jgi:hypothetical protein
MPPEGWKYRCLQCGRYHLTLESLDECLGGHCPCAPAPWVDRRVHPRCMAQFPSTSTRGGRRRKVA